MTQVGCLSKQEFDALYPPEGSSCENLLEDQANGNTTAERSHNRRGSIRRASTRLDNDKAHDADDLTEHYDKKEKEKSGGAMFSMQNCTLQSNDSGNGESYWVSFEEKSFSKGEDFKVYSGKMNGIGPKSGEKCVVKVFRQYKGTERLCSCEVKKSEKAKELAKAFNCEAKKNGRKIKIKVATIYWAQMDEVSKLKQLFFTGERRLSTNEAVLFEEDIRVNDEKPNKPRTPIVFMDCHGRNKRCIAKDLEAFAHFTYHHSNGELVVCGFDGVQDEDGFYLKTPTIHSKAKEFGNKDLGEQGMREVFSHHVCNDFCHGFLKPTGDLSEVQVGSGDAVSDGKCLSAPPSDWRPVYQRQNSRISQVTDSIPSPCIGQPALQWQESKVSHSNSSPASERPTPWRQESNMSVVTESSSGYLEPSAPNIDECNETVFMPTPPPYSEIFVANWLLGEQAVNSFIPAVPEDPLGHRRDILLNQMSVDSGPVVSAPVHCQETERNLNEGDLDMNANFAFADDLDISGVSTAGCADDCDSSDRDASVQFDQKQVRFSLSQGANSSIAPSTTATTNSHNSPTDMSTAASGTSSRSQLRSILRQQSAPSSGYHSYRDYPRPTPKPRTLNRQHERVLAVHESTSTHSLPENPPSYFDSVRATAYWIEGGYIPHHVYLGNANNTDNGHSTSITPNAFKPSAPVNIPLSRNNQLPMKRSA